MGNVMVTEMYVYFSIFYPKKHDSHIYIFTVSIFGCSINSYLYEQNFIYIDHLIHF
jgi:hypothetical protein